MSVDDGTTAPSGRARIERNQPGSGRETRGLWIEFATNVAYEIVEADGQHRQVEHHTFSQLALFPVLTSTLVLHSRERLLGRSARLVFNENLSYSLQG